MSKRKQVKDDVDMGDAEDQSDVRSIDTQAQIQTDPDRSRHSIQRQRANRNRKKSSMSTLNGSIRNQM